MTAPIKIFLSYRRDDTSGHALHLHDDLAERYEEVFMDIGMKPGVAWEDEIERKIGSCDAFVALIGPRWLTATDSKGQRRLDNPKDPLRREIEAAVWREMPLIPVLVEDAEMPTEEDLPAGLAPLPQRQALEIRNRSWRYDVEQLFETLDEIAVGKAPPPPPPPRPPPPKRPSRTVLIAAALLLVAVAVLAAVLIDWPDGDNGGDGNGRGGGGSESEERITYASKEGIFSFVVGSRDKPVAVAGTAAGDASPDWSRDGKRLAVARLGQIFVVGEDEPVSTGTSAALPAWSPDGSMIAFTRDEKDVWVVAPDGSREEDLTKDQSGAVPDWSRDGRRIVYQRQGLIYEMWLDDRRQEKLDLKFEGSPSLRRPKWSPSRHELAVRVGRNNEWDIYIVDPLTGEVLENVTEDVRVPDDADFPAWSPDGDRIAFAAANGIWVGYRDGTDPKRVFEGTGLSHPSWQPSSEG